MNTGPLAHPFDKTLLDRLREDISKSLNLGSVFLGGDCHLMAALEDGAAPAGKAVRLSRQLRCEVAHESCDLLRAFGDSQDVKMVGEGRDGVESQLVPPPWARSVPLSGLLV